MFSNNTHRVEKKAVRNTFGFKEMATNSIYLGDSPLLSRNKNKDFSRLKDNITQRIEGWNRNLLSKAGKTTIITSVIQAILTYAMSMFRMPKRLCNDLDAVVCRFWWGSKKEKDHFLAFKAWKEIC